ncbi:MAG: DNA-binding protein, partial [Acidimicrobiia bacterium]|nr:DNA-binding protein [Acidimicrobiia bacterium]
TEEALAYIRVLRPDHLHAVHVSLDGSGGARVRDAWDARRFGFPLELVPSPYRDLTGPVLRYLDQIDRADPDDVITVIIPDYVVAHWWDNLLHNQSTRALRTKLRERPNTVVTMVPLLAGQIRHDAPPPARPREKALAGGRSDPPPGRKAAATPGRAARRRR